MRLENFTIGETFFASAGFKWLCTDKGARSITAIMLDPQLEDYWFKGPPYAVEEVVFNEGEMEKCYTNEVGMLMDRCDDIESSAHPNFFHEDVVKMFRDKLKDRAYPRKKLLKLDRIGFDGSILHPYGATKINDDWFILIFEIFTREYSQMHENDFVRLDLSSEMAMRKRKSQLGL